MLSRWLTLLKTLVVKNNEKNSRTAPSRGLGDTIEKFTKATGIKKVVDTVAKATGKDCGCGQRRDTLNRVFPYQQ